jgi:hypothetical protein
MKLFTTKTKDTCWRDCLACLLEIKPGRVPDFVKLYGDSYMEETRKWLKEEWNRGLVYIPVNAFMETGTKIRQNGPIGPDGFSIGYMNMVEEDIAHAVVCFNGGVCWDNGQNRAMEYSHISGYFVIYDLDGSKVKIECYKKKKKKVKGIK